MVVVVLLMTLFCNNAIMVKAESSENKVIVSNEITQVFNDYFEVRENAFYAGSNNQTRMLAEVYNNLSVESEVLAIESVRNAGIEAYIEACDIEVVNVTTSYSVGECETISSYQNSEYLSEARYSIYEWTWIEYTADGKNIENMGMGTEHEITVAFDGENYVIISDEYDESDISGVCTLEETYVEDVEEIDFATYAQDDGIELTSLYNSQRELDINAFIEYADAWVYHSPEDGEYYPTYYNPKYYYYPSNDCANYASQCLHAAGMPFDNTGSYEWWAHVTDNTEPDEGTTENSTDSWRRVGHFKTYWTVNQEYEVWTFNQENRNDFLTPGCVIVTNDKKHAMVCVGYNNAGVPTINGHTNDRYHKPVAGFISSGFVIKFTYESPNSYTTLSVSTTQQSGTISSAGTKYYYKFVPASTGFYDIYTESSIDMAGKIYTESIHSMNGNSYGITQIYDKDDNGSSNGSDFWLMPYLTAGETYYIEVSASSTGSYVLHID